MDRRTFLKTVGASLATLTGIAALKPQKKRVPLSKGEFGHLNGVKWINPEFNVPDDSKYIDPTLENKDVDFCFEKTELGGKRYGFTSLDIEELKKKLNFNKIEPIRIDGKDYFVIFA